MSAGNDQPAAGVGINTSAGTGDAVFEITRVFNATRERVWTAWSNAEQLQHWWGPKGCAIEVMRLEFRPGGLFHYAMKFPGAPVMWGRFNYREIVPGERIVWLNSFANENCGILRAPFSELCPLEIENRVAFVEEAGKTTLSLRAQPFGALAPERAYFENLRPSLAEGYGGTLEQLESLLNGS
jgi:uncharacterized protein YndB with AHSA1/START domain